LSKSTAQTQNKTTAIDTHQYKVHKLLTLRSPVTGSFKSNHRWCL